MNSPVEQNVVSISRRRRAPFDSDQMGSNVNSLEKQDGFDYLHAGTAVGLSSKPRALARRGGCESREADSMLRRFQLDCLSDQEAVPDP
jgi:hypothetical protein